MKRNLIKLVRLGLRVHSAFHLLEFISALYETAYITASVAFVAMVLELAASYLIPKEHIHIKPLISDVHESCSENQ
ncbi:MAG: hypothetical protein HOD79_00520 [Flavobacteriaceae bacterium]|jgi:hypothetical protein|nr:hypothetical protein [Flavobacteriaceae bacterium]MBT4063120.1 hypothetical protein [Flavobacteriaceae bacterium]MBT4245819.1 hypothetical protein [Flavobacteriaceae bacterium]MBT7320384.1 hypothetical protein [Flavobacteriaceae bacterium]|tara:strand:- start:403 stop:630 length:228 start_codon:yes stop_codon:yes gene_type:complete